MPRIRSIKPEFFQDEDLARLDPIDRLAFIGIFCHADREGRLEDRPQRLKVQILPYEKTDMEKVVDRLVGMNFLIRYEVDGHKYLQVRTFKKHQRPHHTESDSIIPPCPSPNGSTTVVERVSNGVSTLGGGNGGGKGKEEEDTPTGVGGSLPRLAQAWNRIAEGGKVPRVTVIGPPLLRAIRARLQEGTVEEWETAYRLIAADPFLTGQNESSKVYATFEYATRPGKSGKWLDAARNGEKPHESTAARMDRALNGELQ